MYVLGIETSCDETAAAVVKDGRRILSNEVSSSLNFHKKYGGIIPEIASRRQLETIAAVTDAALREARIRLKDIGLISVTNCPGLVGSLLVGVAFARAVALSSGIPLLEVDHIHSHIYANFLNGGAPKLPFAALVVSGGHTSLFYVRAVGEIETLGETQDDACGEAFDKVAKILGLGYPGGPEIERLSKRGNPGKIKFVCSGTRGQLDFSFSGIKTAVLYYVSKRQTADGRRPTGKENPDIAASFQEAVVGALLKKSLLACRLKQTNRLVVGGGVAANQRLREKFYAAFKEEGLSCYFPPRPLCTDNAAMVAALGYRLFNPPSRNSLPVKAGMDSERNSASARFSLSPKRREKIPRL